LVTSGRVSNGGLRLRVQGGRTGVLGPWGGVHEGAQRSRFHIEEDGGRSVGCGGSRVPEKKKQQVTGGVETKEKRGENQTKKANLGVPLGPGQET